MMERQYQVVMIALPEMARKMDALYPGPLEAAMDLKEDFVLPSSPQADRADMAIATQ